VRDVADLKLALTHIQHAGRPVRVVWFGGEPQAAVMSSLGRMEGVTLLALMERAPSTTGGDAWQAIFWAPDAGQEDVEAAVGARMGSGAVGGQLRAVLKELRASNVGLIWSSIGESDRRGSLYWYDPQEESDLQPVVDFVEAADMLRRVADVLVAKTNSPF
jgi:NAD(P)H-dependent FMN reductase